MISGFQINDNEGYGIGAKELKKFKKGKLFNNPELKEEIKSFIGIIEKTINSFIIGACSLGNDENIVDELDETVKSSKINSDSNFSLFISTDDVCAPFKWKGEVIDAKSNTMYLTPGWNDVPMMGGDWIKVSNSTKEPVNSGEKEFDSAQPSFITDKKEKE